MKKLTQITGVCGLAIGVLGLFARLIQGQGSLVITLHLVLGGLLLLVGVLTNLAEIRETLLKRRARYGSGALFQLCLWVVVLGMFNYLAVRHDWFKDLTRHRLYSLDEQTLNILQHLPGPVEVTAFFQGDSYENDRRRLELYAEASPRFQLSFVDPDQHPELAEKKSIAAYGTLLFQFGGKSVRITQHEESDITNALVKATRTGEKVIYFLAGHEEADPASDDKAGLSILQRALEDQNYQTKGFFLTQAEVPEDATVVVIASPRLPLPDEELLVLGRYLDRGGHLLVMVDPLYETRLDPLLQRFNLELDPDMIIDQVHSLSSKDQLGISPICSDIRPHAATANLNGKLLVFPRARSLHFLNERPQSMLAKPLVYTSKDSYGETNLTQLGNGMVRHDPEDLSGPLLVAASVIQSRPLQPWEQQPHQPKRHEIRLVVVGNSRFLRNADIGTYSNFLFALNVLNWLAGEEEYIFLPATRRSGNRIFLSQNQKQLIFYSSVLVLPELLMILGVAIWWRRR